MVQLESIHKLANTKPSRSANGTQIIGYENTAGTPGEQDELWKFTLCSVTFSNVTTALERNGHQLDDMHVISKDHM